MPTQLPSRKKNRLPAFDYATAGAYFVTICIAGRHHILWSDTEHPSPGCVALNHIGLIAQQGLQQLSLHYPHISVEKYCIMPDHVHLLLFHPDKHGRQIAAPTLSGAIGQLKRWVSMQLGFSIWQKSFYDRIIRNEAAYHEVWQYIDENPLRMQLGEHHT